MRLDLIQNMRMEQRMKLAPRMIQSMEILQLPIMALQERIQQEIQENPVLEVEDFSSDPDSPRSEEAENNPETLTPSPSDSTSPADDEPDADEDPFLLLASEWSENVRTSYGVSRGRVAEESERKHDAMQNMASRPQSLHDYLLDQFAFFDCSDRVREIGRSIIQHLNNDGYLTVSLEEVAAGLGGGVKLEEAQEALRLVQKLDPPGVGARDLKECLLLQLSPDHPHYEVLRHLISDHLEDVEHNRLPLVARKSGYPLSTIKSALEELKHLRFRPGADFHREDIPRVVPDLVVESEENGRYQVRLIHDHIPNLQISRWYQRLLQSGNTDRQTKQYVQKKIQSARWLIESIEQRHNTLRKVAQAIVDHQKNFLEKGPECIEPLKMQQIADRVGVHVTTVSRAVDDKWIQTPRGIFPLKRFFGGGTVTADGESVAWDIIRQRLLDIVEKEDKAKPYSDEDLVEKLASQGFEVARRTVTKYRKALGIPSSRHRRQF